MPQKPKDPFATITEDPLAGLAEDSGETQGQRYMTARRAGKLPTYDVSEVPRIRAQEAQTAASPEKYVQGKFAGHRPFYEQIYRGMQSGLIEAGGVTDKLIAGFTDPKTLAAFAISKLSPSGQVAAQMYFGLQSSQGMVDAINKGKISPDNVQDFLLNAAGYVGAAGMSKDTPASIKERLAGAKARAQSFGRGATEARSGLKATAEKASQVGERISLEQDVDRRSTAVGKQIEAIENKVYKEANRKFDAVKEKVGADKPGEPTEDSKPLTDVVNGVQQNILRGFPETVPIFRQILNLGGESGELAALRQDVMKGQQFPGKYEDLPPEQKGLVDDIAKRYGGEISPGEGLKWGQLQRVKTATETAMRARSTAPILKEALGQVRNTVVDMMGRMAESKGAGAEWKEANDFYRQWREDFHQTSGPQGSASPIAQTLDAVDPKNIRQTLMRTQGATENRAITTLRKYAQFGGNEAAEAAQKLIETHGRSLELPRKAAGVKVAGQEKPTIDAEEISRKKIQETAGRIGRLNAWDARVLAGSAIVSLLSPFIGLKGGVEMGATYVGSKLILARALEHPKVVAWLAKPPAEEVAALQRLPGMDKVKIGNAITDQAVEEFKMNAAPDQSAIDRAKAELGPNPDSRALIQLAQKYKTASGETTATRVPSPRYGTPINLPPELRKFLGPKNVARILAASGQGPVTKPVQNRREAMEAVPKP